MASATDPRTITNAQSLVTTSSRDQGVRRNTALPDLKIIQYDPKNKEKGAGRKIDHGNEHPPAHLRPRPASRPVPSSLNPPLKSNTWDPFGSLAVLYVSREERLMLNYAYTRLWPVWGKEHGQAWMSGATESGAIFHAQIFAAASHYLINRRKDDSPMSKALTSLRIRSKALTIEGLRREVDRYHSSPQKVPIARLLMPVVALAINDDIDASGEDEAMPMSSISLLRDMDVYSRMSFGEEHMDVLFRLIGENGGVENAGKGAIGTIAPLLDLAHAARKQRLPCLPCQWQLKPLQTPEVWQADSRARDLFQVSGSYFQAVADRVPTLPGVALFPILASLAEACVVLDHVQRSGMKVLKNPLVWLDNSNWACHALLSTSPIQIPRDVEFETAHIGESPHLWPMVFELCRMAGVIYINMAIFPQRHKQTYSGLHQSAALYEMLEAIHQEASPYGWIEVCDVIRWAAILGAICLGSKSDREKFILFIANSCISGSSLGLEWEHVEADLDRFLWLRHIFQEPGRVIWQQAQALKETQLGLNTSVK